MIRAAAKNHDGVGVVVDPNDYDKISQELIKNNCCLTKQTTKRLALKAYSRTASYDATISNWLSSQLDEQMGDFKAVGGNSRAAFLMGVPVQRVQFLMFIQVGVAAALAGLMLSSKLAAATPITGQGLEINALTVVLLGGVAFAGGIGRISGVVAGLFFVGVLRNGLVVTDTSQFLQQVLIGVTLIAAVAIDDTFRQTLFKSSTNVSKARSVAKKHQKKGRD